MANKEDKKEDQKTSGGQKASEVMGMDRNEGQTLNGNVGGVGSDLENVSDRLGGNESEINSSKNSESNTKV